MPRLGATGRRFVIGVESSDGMVTVIRGGVFRTFESEISTEPVEVAGSGLYAEFEPSRYSTVTVTFGDVLRSSVSTERMSPGETGPGLLEVAKGSR